MNEYLLWASTSGIKIYDTNKKSIFYVLQPSPSINPSFSNSSLNLKNVFSFTVFNQVVFLASGQFFCTLRISNLNVEILSSWRQFEMNIFKIIKMDEENCLFLCGENGKEKKKKKNEMGKI